MGYFSTLKRNEILTPATTWVNLENVMLSEISQTQKDKYLGLLLYEEHRIGKYIEKECRIEISGGGFEGEEGKLLFNGWEASV